jgi:DNA-binding protein HU-beta
MGLFGADLGKKPLKTGSTGREFRGFRRGVCKSPQRRQRRTNRSEALMNRRELVLALSERLEVDRRTADTALGTVLEIITESVAKGEPVAISGFAKFARRDLPARTVRNNFTGEMVKRPASKKVRITPLKAFKDAAISGKVPKKAPVKKATAKKAATGRVTGTTARARVSTSGTTTARKTTATRATATKAPARKTAATKAPARKAAAKKTTARTPATRTATKAPARKTAAKKVPARAATVKKAATAKKAPARRTTTATRAR